MKYLSHFFILILFCAGCTKTESDNIPEHLSGIQNLTIYDSDETAQFDIKFIPTLVFEESDELMFGRIPDIAVDEYERVYLSEIGQNHAAIHAFESDGSYLTSIGGYGDGPGEFRSAINPQIKDGYLYTLDGSKLKINVYSLQSFEFEKSIQLNPRNWRNIEELSGASAYDFTVVDSNKILMTFLKSEGQKDLVYRYMMNSSGEIISDKIVEQVLAEHFVKPNNSGIFYSPFTSRGLIAITDDENLYTIWTEEIHIKKHAIDGKYQSSFYHPFQNKELSQDEVLNYNDSEIYEASVRNTGFPEEWPAIHSVVLDHSENFWISTIIDNENNYQCWVLNSEGEILTKFYWPKKKSIKVVTDESLFALETDPDSGIQKVVKYQYQFEKE